MNPTPPKLQDSLLSVENRVASLIFNRHDVRNALTGTAIVDDIVDTVDWINASSEVSVLIITGAGSAFSSGGNIKEMANAEGAFSGSPEELEIRYRTGIQRMPRAMARLQVPSIAAVNGPAIGAGFDLANMCDMRFASDKARFGETFINLGIIPGDGGAWYLQRLIGPQKAAELTYTGRIIDAQEALALGLLLDVTAPDQLLQRVGQTAAQIASKPPAALRKTKQLMQLARTSELDPFLDVCAQVQSHCHHTEEHHAAVQDMLAKMSKS